MAHFLDASIAGSMATMAGVIFGLVYLFAPKRGLVAIAMRRANQKWEFAETMLVIHLFNHENLPEAEVECKVDHLNYHLKWDKEFAESVVKRSIQDSLATVENDTLHLTDTGRDRARKSIEV